MSDTDDLTSTLERIKARQLQRQNPTGPSGMTHAHWRDAEDDVGALCELLERIRQRLDATQDSVRQMDRLLKRHEDLNDQLQDSWNAERERAEQAEERVRALTDERDWLLALVGPAEKIREAHMRHPGGLGVYAGTPEYELIMALDALSDPTATTEKPAHPGLEQGVPYELAHDDWHHEHGEDHAVSSTATTSEPGEEATDE